MVSALRLLAIFAGVACVATIGFAAEPKEPPKPEVEIRWVERFRVEGLTVDRIVGESGDSPGYYPHAKPAMILTAKDIVEARLSKFDLLMSGMVVRHYSVTLVLTKDARERLAKSCPGKSAAIAASLNGIFTGWSHYTTDNDAKVSEDSKAKNYNPILHNVGPAGFERIINAFMWDDPKKDTEKIQGTWKLVSLETDGEQAPAEIVDTMKLVFKDDKLTFTPGEPGFTHYSYKLDPSAKSASFDMTHADDKNKSKTQKGIYTLEGDSLKICFGQTDQRPKEFTAKAKSQQTMYVLKRNPAQ